MFRLRSLSALVLTAGFALAACDGSGGHQVPDEENQATSRPDSMSAGTNIPPVLPPAGTVNPNAPSGPGTDPNADSTVQTQGATGGPVQSGATGPVGNATGQTTADSAKQ
ncbi:hypothetical protein [Longimicrobium terrae]|uniref:Lipoprotein n=1 Tax=Longimicrobium terrae TaxID=1639882 RepID=A0A841GXK0_9BACT|nr:hypothetical protein [Longimicrobium terrae]MBB4636080.1 hypothetical protein [Longimicrobium terrae]MBB6070475.1 hypothetical protein [Longimicrobium terrae]NNC29466.1 hypothetical protein [Longimicrobium terrae]